MTLKMKIDTVRERRS